MFTCEELILRKITKNDLPELTYLKSESWMNTHRTSILNDEDQLKWYSNLPNDPHTPSSLILIASHVDASSISIGDFKIANIDWVNRTADVGWDVFHRSRKRGFGKKIVKAGAQFCFNILNLRRLSCEILEYNLASQRCAFSAKFALEGTKRMAVFKNGCYHDSLCYGLLSENFFAEEKHAS